MFIGWAFALRSAPVRFTALARSQALRATPELPGLPRREDVQGKVPLAWRRRPGRVAFSLVPGGRVAGAEVRRSPVFPHAGLRRTSAPATQPCSNGRSLDPARGTVVEGNAGGPCPPGVQSRRYRPQ